MTPLSRKNVFRHANERMTDDTVRVVLPFKDQISADMVKEQLKDPSQPENWTRTECERSKATDSKWAAVCAEFITSNVTCVMQTM